MTEGRGLFRSETMTQALSVYLPATAVFRLVGFGRSVLLTWLMVEQAEFGLFALALVVINLLNPLCSLGLNEAVTRYTPMYETRQMLRSFLARVIPIVWLVAFLTSTLLMSYSKAIGPLLFQTVSPDKPAALIAWGRSVALMQHVVWAVFSLIIYFLALSILKGLRMYRALSLIELTHGVVFTALAIISVKLGHGTSMSLTACYMMSLWIALGCFALPAALHLMLEPGQDEPLRGDPLFRRLLAFSLWAALAAIMWQGLQNYPLWYLNRVHGAQAAGVFGAMRAITQYVLIAAVTIATVAMTAVTKHWEADGREPADRLLALSFKATSLLLLTLCVVVAVLRDQVVLIFDPRYRGGAEAVPILLLTFLTAGNLSFMAIHFNLIEKTRFLFWPWALGLATNALVGVWLVRGVAGHAVTTAAAPQAGPAFAWLTCRFTTEVGSAAWTGAIGMVVALAVCVALLRVERRPVDRGAVILLLAALVLAVRWYVSVPVVAILWLVAWRGSTLFSEKEKAQLGERWRHVRSWLNPPRQS